MKNSSTQNNYQLSTQLQTLLNQMDSAQRKELQLYLNVNRTQLWRWEKGKQRPDPDNAEQLCIYFADQGLDYNGCYEVKKVTA